MNNKLRGFVFMFYARSTISIVGVFITCISTVVPIPASAQSLFDMMVSRALNDPTTLITLNEYGNFIQAASGPFSLPGVSSASFQVSRGTQLGDGEFSRLVLPISHSFESLEFGGITPYSEVTFSYTDQKQNQFWMEGTPMQMMVRHNIETASIMGGLGLDFEPVEGLIIRPIVHLGWSRIKDNRTRPLRWDKTSSKPSERVYSSGKSISFNMAQRSRPSTPRLSGTRSKSLQA